MWKVEEWVRQRFTDEEWADIEAQWPAYDRGMRESFGDEWVDANQAQLSAEWNHALASGLVFPFSHRGALGRRSE